MENIIITQNTLLILKLTKKGEEKEIFFPDTAFKLTT